MEKETTEHPKTPASDNPVSVLWLTPDKPENISVGRQRIADHLEERGFDVTTRGTSWRTVARSLRERTCYDAVIGTTRAGAVSGGLLKTLGIPLLVDHIDPIRQFAENNPRWLTVIVRLLENVSFLAADHVFYVYDEERPRIKRYASSYSKTDLGVEFNRFADPDPEIVESARSRLETLDLGEQVAIYVGGLEPTYHIRELLAAMGHLPDWSLVLIGTGSLQDTVSAAATERSNVHYLGTVPHETVPGYLQAADVGVSLVDDPHTLKVLEYGAAGLPVVQAAGRAEARFGDRVEYCEVESTSIASAISQAENLDTDELQAFASRFRWPDLASDYAEAVRTGTQ